MKKCPLCGHEVTDNASPKALPWLWIFLIAAAYGTIAYIIVSIYDGEWSGLINRIFN